MQPAASSLLVLGRILIALIFVRGGVNKLGAIAATAANMRNHGIPYSDLLVWGAVVMEMGGGLLLIAGLFTRWAAAALFFYTLVLAVIFHAFWAAPAAAVRTETSTFLGHLSMMGGMLFVVVFGAGAYSLDALWLRRNRPGWEDSGVPAHARR